MKLRGLYAITPEGLGTEALVAAVRGALDGGAAVLQYRNKMAGAALRREQAQALLALARKKHVPLIVNDDVELAVSIDADGVHLGKDDGEVAAARLKLPGKLLGASCYESLERARQAVAAGADYVAFGSMFLSATKPQAIRAPLGLFRQARALGVPLVAIGGITIGNAAALVDAGADCIAVIAGLFSASDIRSRAAEFARLYANPPAISP